MSRGLKRMSDIFEDSRGKKSGIGKAIFMASIASAWQDHFKDRFPTGSAVNSIRDGVLHVSIDEPVWAQHLSMQKKQILTELSGFCDTSGIKDIRFSSFGSTQKPHRIQSSNTTDSAGTVKGRTGASSNAADPAARQAEPEAGVNRKDKRAYFACGICGMGFSGNGKFCPVCKNIKHAPKVAEATKYLMGTPIASNPELSGACGLDALEPDEAFEVILSARIAAGRRLVQEALTAANKKKFNRKLALMLMTASVCASTGKPSDVIISSGLERYFLPSVLEAAGLSPEQRLESEEKP